MAVESESHVTHHGPCDLCGSRDNRAHYSDGHSYCFGCKTRIDSEDTERPAAEYSSSGPLVDELEYIALTKRGLTLDTCRTWGYGIAHGVRFKRMPGSYTCQVENFYDTQTGKRLVAQHFRMADPERGKTFRWKGDKNKSGLYGMHLFPNPGKMCVITEGAIDAMTVSQLQSHKWPVYSLPNGVSSAKKDIGRVLSFLEQFEQIVLMFDMDEPGQEAAKEVAALFTPGKVGIAKLPLKDANDMLRAGRGKELLDAMWAGTRNKYRPDGVVTGESLWEAMTKEDTGTPLPFPWKSVNEKLVGLRPGQILLIPGGTGVGKSTVGRDIVSYWHKEFGEKVGIIALEETLKDTTCELIDTARGKRGSIDLPLDELRVLFDEYIGEDWDLFNHMGSASYQTIEERIRYFVKVSGCTTIVFDHILAAVEGEDDAGHEQVARVMNRLRRLVGELNIRLIMPTHIKSVEGRAFEEGANVRLIDLKYPALRQYANKILALERNQQARDPYEFRFRVLKCRGEQGLTGPAGAARWDPITNAITEVESPTGTLEDEEVGLDESEDLESAPF